ncbi:MAG: hypothetical protein U0Q18_34340 [Bryobacteraceae bacterium]
MNARLIVVVMAGSLFSAGRAASQVVINVSSGTTVPVQAKFSGFNAPQIRNGVEYYDPKFMAVVTPLKPGWVRYPGGTGSMAFDWVSAHMNTAWMAELASVVPASTTSLLTTAQQLTQAKGGVSFSDFTTFAQTLGANAIVCFNGFTDTTPGSISVMAHQAQQSGLNVIEWELNNEPYQFPLIYPSSSSYAAAMYNPYFTELVGEAPSATAGVFFQGAFSGSSGNAYKTWDSGLSSYTPQYWNAASIHIYPLTNTTLTPQQKVQTLNGILAYGSAQYISTYVIPKTGPNTSIFVTELNCCLAAGDTFLTVQYNGIFLAEYTARLSRVPNVKAVGVHSLYSNIYDYHGAVRSIQDFQTYLVSQVLHDPNYSTNTATDPNTQYQFYTTAPGLAMQIANSVINDSAASWTTSVTGGPTVPILGYDGKPVRAVYAQAYQGLSNNHYVLITNKASTAQSVNIQVDNASVTAPLQLTYISNPSATASNTALAPNTIQIQTAIAANPITVGPYSVTAVSW